MACFNQAYHERRAEEQLELAQRAHLAAVVKAHVELAELHLAMIHEPPANEDVVPRLVG